MRPVRRLAVPLTALLACALPGAAAAAPAPLAPPGATVVGGVPARPAATTGLAAPTALTPSRLTQPDLGPAERLVPKPREVALTAGTVPVPDAVTLVLAGDVDPRVTAEARAVLTELGAESIEEIPLGETPGTAFVLAVADAPSAEATAALGVLGTTPVDPAVAEGYALAVGALGPIPATVVAGSDAAGAFHGLQTLRQLATPAEPAAVVPLGSVRDWPELGLRGVIEGFYGEPWSHADRLDVVDFLGDVKGNSYVYAPKDDPYHLEQWREPYPPAERAEIAELVAASEAEMVSLIFTISPGQDICYSDPDDVDALLGKMDAMWDIGVRQFGIFYDDIDLELDCAADVAAYAGAASPAAAAQADLLTTVLDEFVAARPEALPLLTVPTEYSGTGESDYKTTFAADVPADVVVYWTGPEVVSDTITAEATTEAVALWAHPLAIWDNYPVNDFAQARLFMGPLIGRDADLGDLGVLGFSANPMNQARASQVPLATVHDYLWNPAGYDPDASWDAALALVGGETVEALRIFAENNYASDIGHPANPELAGRVAAFTEAWEDDGDVAAAATALTEYLQAMADVPDALRAGADAELVDEIEPWMDKVGAYGEAGVAAVASLLADAAGEETTAWQQRQVLEDAAARADDLDVEVSGGIMAAFLAWAREASELVVLTAPQAGATFDAGDDIALAARVRAGDVEVAEVAFYAGVEEIAVDTAAPYEVTWQGVPEGMPSLYAVATDAEGTAVASGTVRITVGSPDPVLLVVGPPGGLSTADAAGDLATAARLAFLGYPVEVGVAPEVTTEDAAGKAAVVVSESVSSGDVGTKFRDVDVPVAAWEHFVYDDMAMADAPNLAFNSTDVEITGADHPIAVGLSGTVGIYQREGIAGYGTPSDEADVIAIVPGVPEQATVFAYDAGDAMIGMDAPARRLGLPYVDDAVGVLTPEGQAMFDAAMLWLIEGEQEVPTEEPTEEPTGAPTGEPTTGGPSVPGPTPPGATPPGAAPPGQLPSTGAPTTALALVALLATLAGLGTLATRRRTHTAPPA
ncbi:beta-N-acetylglucosaminidase domain-containing protein [Georgenia wangjunii]|uniref:beta-N-acetylglucosaminidase domain-containing protein n=1 Tax=Georgenia wangjunii TaxID=3117730 RepID=UPI002F26035A